MDNERESICKVGIQILRILICDNEKMICDAVCAMIHQFMIKENIEDIEIVTYLSGDALLEDKGDADIVFLDVKLGKGMDGISVGNELKERNPKTIIFLMTAFEEFNDDAFRMEAFRFIHKPFDEPRFYRNLKEALQLYYTPEGKICVEDGNDIWSVHVADIIFIESNGRGVMIHTKTGTKYSTKNIEQWDEIMEQKCFVRTHKSYIVNMNYILFTKKGIIYFEHCQEQAYLTKRRVKEFKSRYKEFIASKSH